MQLALDRGKSLSSMQTNVKDVLYVPGLCTNLLSISQLIQNENSIKFDANGCDIFRTDGVFVGRAMLIDNMYKLIQCSSATVYATNGNADSDLWYRRYGHAGHNKMSSLS